MKVKLTGAILVNLVMILCLMGGCSRSGFLKKPAETVVQDDPNSISIVSLDERNITSAESIQPTGRNRPWREQVAYFQMGSVKHEPIYFTGVYDDCTEFPVNFRIWNRNDIEATLLPPAEFLVDLVFLPWQLYRNPPIEPDTSRSVYPYVSPCYEIPCMPASLECGR